MKRIVYLGNVWEYPRALAAIPGVRLTALLYEGEGDAEAALRTAKRVGVRSFRVRTDNDVRLALAEAAVEAEEPIDLGIIANFGIILTAATLAAVKEGFVNFHPGLLPGQAGRAPVSQVWSQGGGPSGLTIHAVTPEPDAGPILGCVPFQIDPVKTLDSNIHAIYQIGLPFLSRTLFSSSK